jgi:hypothetical protein
MNDTYFSIETCFKDILAIEKLLPTEGKIISNPKFNAGIVYDVLLRSLPVLETVAIIHRDGSDIFEDDAVRIDRIKQRIRDMIGADFNKYEDSVLLFLIIDLIENSDNSYNEYKEKYKNIKHRLLVLDIIEFWLLDIPYLTLIPIFMSHIFVDNLYTSYSDISNLPTVRESYDNIISDSVYALETIVIEMLKDLSDAYTINNVVLDIEKLLNDEGIDMRNESAVFSIVAKVVSSCVSDTALCSAFAYIDVTTVLCLTKVEPKKKFFKVMRSVIATINLKDEISEISTYHRREVINERLDTMIKQFLKVLEDVDFFIDVEKTVNENLEMMFAKLELDQMDIVTLTRERLFLMIAIEDVINGELPQEAFTKPLHV